MSYYICSTGEISYAFNDWRQSYDVISICTALHGMPAQTSYEKAFRLSVRLSVSQTRALHQDRRKFCPDFSTIRKIS